MILNEIKGILQKPIKLFRKQVRKYSNEAKDPEVNAVEKGDNATEGIQTFKYQDSGLLRPYH
jgi:hypothetical protein